MKLLIIVYDSGNEEYRHYTGNRFRPFSPLGPQPNEP